ncbi:hypothetical protein SAMN05216505_104217 [Streptomyces prasinopilosus]|uniref:Protein kinase domain-containing protein n=1 Tax=Streptomyces prasinopilosus TaxID=67344 RepID=A0A1G6QQQ3_9ACTN|nr:hypothetical protein SAMN05216505_104217 [Streptomyces prasinopilosus]
MRHATGVFRPLQDDDPREAGGYRLVARLGAGGTGRVHLSHTPGGRPVAAEVVRPEPAGAPAFRRRPGREVGAARKVKGACAAELAHADPDGVPPGRPRRMCRARPSRRPSPGAGRCRCRRSRG